MSNYDNAIEKADKETLEMLLSESEKCIESTIEVRNNLGRKYYSYGVFCLACVVFLHQLYIGSTSLIFHQIIMIIGFIEIALFCTTIYLNFKPSGYSNIGYEPRHVFKIKNFTKSYNRNINILALGNGEKIKNNNIKNAKKAKDLRMLILANPVLCFFAIIAYLLGRL